MDRRSELQQELERAQAELEQAQAALPAHSVRPWQWQRVEELEDQVAELKQRLASLTGPED